MECCTFQSYYYCFSKNFCEGKQIFKPAGTAANFLRENKWLAAISATAILAVALSAAAAQNKAANIFIADKGKFTIQLDGQTVAHEDFEIAPAANGWVAKGTTELKIPKTPTSTVSGTLTMQPDGTPISYDW